MNLEFERIAIEKDEDTSAIFGHAGFIKTVEDLYEAMVGSVPGIKFGIAFAEASGPCLVRSDGNDDDLTDVISKIVAGHSNSRIDDAALPVRSRLPQNARSDPTENDSNSSLRSEFCLNRCARSLVTN